MTHDIVIVGAGPAGLSFARSLADSGLRIALVEKQSQKQLAEPEFDGRDIALTHLSVRILNELGIWSKFKPIDRPEIRRARVLDGTSPYSLWFNGDDDSSEALGYIVSNHMIRRVLFEEIQPRNDIEVLFDLAVTSVSTNDAGAEIQLSDGRTLASNLVVAADSRFSDTRRMMGIPASIHDFGRVCIVCRMEHEKSHDCTAYECFQYGRTLAVLPLSANRCSVVVTAPMQHRDSIMAMNEDDFAADIQRRFNNRFGTMKLATARFDYPLVGVHAARFHATRFALIGDAAVGMHPVTAHGYNLGLSGQDILAREIAGAMARDNDIGAMPLLAGYQRKHMRTTRPMYHGTNEMVKFFTDDRAPAKIARKAALRLANNLPPLKRAIQNKLTETTRRTGII